MEKEKETAQQDTLMCPKNVGNRYFKSVCETVFRISKHRPWCRECPHFTTAAGTENEKSEPPPESAKQQT
jgi:hypothetical protein